MAFEEAAKQVDLLTLTELDEPMLFENHQGRYILSDLPLKKVERGTLLKHVVIINEKVKDVNIQDVFAQLGEQQELPDPFKSTRPPPSGTKIQMCMMPAGAGAEFTFVRHIVFASKLKIADIKTLYHGEVHTIDYKQNFRNGSKIFQYLWNNLKGTIIKSYSLEPTGSVKKTSFSVDEMNVGFDFIELKAPRQNSKNQMTRWVEVEIRREESPIFNWNPALVKEACRNLMSFNSLVTTCHYHPITLKGIRGYWLDKVFYKVIQNLHDKTLLLLGEANVGKTPVSRAIAMAMSRYWIAVDNVASGRAGYRTASSLDFFRGEPGMKYIPDVFDDGNLSNQGVEKMKAFFDSSLTEGMTYERWGASKFAQNQVRIACANQYDPAAEPDLPSPDEGIISAKAFYEMVRPAWNKRADKADIIALMKRVHIVLSTHMAVYFRPAGAAEADVFYFKYPGGVRDFLTDECKGAIGAWKRGSQELPRGFSDDVQWEQAVVKNLMDKQAAPPPTWTIFGPGLFSTGSRISEWKPTLATTPLFEVNRAAVKVEMSQSAASSSSGPVFQALRPATGGVIDLATPPRKVARTGGDLLSYFRDSSEEATEEHGGDKEDLDENEFEKALEEEIDAVMAAEGMQEDLRNTD